MKPVLQPFPFPAGHRAQAWRYQPRYRRPLHFHAEPEVNLIWQGRARFVVGQRSLDVATGSLLVLPPGIEHALVDASDDLEFFAVGFEQGLVAALERESARKLTLGVEVRQLSAPATERLASLCRALGASPDHVASETTLLRLLELADGSERQLALGARAACLVLQHAAALDRNALAKVLASNPGDVSRSFHRDNGITLREFRNRVRVLRFLEAADSTANLTRAALLAGFGSYSQCHRVFSSLLGVSPREYFGSGLRTAQAEKFEPFAGNPVAG